MTDKTSSASPSPAAYPVYLLLGAYFGLVLVKSEAVSWFRIQEMFRFQSFHMYGILGSALLTAMISLWIIRRLNLRTATGEAIEIPPKDKTPGLVRYWAGGLCFGFGWALLGACPGPIYALMGHGETVYLVAFVMALVGTWVYALLRSRLPH